MKSTAAIQCVIQLPGHHVNAMTMRCAQATSRPEAAHAEHARAARSAAALYVAEHSAKIAHVMAGGRRAVEHQLRTGTGADS
jgi:hypothetical protein